MAETSITEVTEDQTPSPEPPMDDFEQGSESQAPLTLTDKQRIALRDLVEMTSQRAEAEKDAEVRFKNDNETVERENREDTRAVAKGYESAKEAADLQHRETLTRIQNDHAAELEQAKTGYEKKRDQLLDEAERKEHSIKEKLTHKIWLAESVAEAGQNELRKLVESARQVSNEQLDAAKKIEDQANQLLKDYKQTPPHDEAEPVPSQSAQADPEAALKRHVDLAEQQLEKLKAMRPPKSRKPVQVLLMLVSLAATGGAVGMAIITQTDLYWIGAGVGGFLFLCVLIWFLMTLGTNAEEIMAVYQPLRGAISKARGDADMWVRRTEEHRDRNRPKLLERRDRDSKAAEQQLEPKLDELAKLREAALAKLKQRHAASLKEIDERFDQMLKDENARYEKESADIEAKHGADSAAAVKDRADRLAARDAEHKAELHELERRWKEGVRRARNVVDECLQLNRKHFPDWTDPFWRKWEPPKEAPSVIRFGTLTVDMRELAEDLVKGDTAADGGSATLTVPAMLAMPDQASLLVQTGLEGRELGISVLQAVMMRLLTTLPAGRVRFTIIDPVGRGQNFAGFMRLADHDEQLVGPRIWTEAEQIAKRLADLTEHMENVIQKYLRNEYETIDQYNAQAAELAEPYRFLIVADFPNNFNDDAARRLASIINTGARCGVYTLMSLDSRLNIPGDVQLADIEKHCLNLYWDQEVQRFVWKDATFSQFPLAVDPPAPDNMVPKLLDVVGAHSKDARRVEVPFKSIAPEPGQEWTSSSDRELAVPVGRCGATRNQNFTVGRGVGQHALLAGKTGSGKSTLLHVFITNAALWYSTDQLLMYLIDFKKGVEFKTYSDYDMPHAQVVSVESDREFGLSVLQKLDAEMKRRGDMYRDASVQDVAGFRKARPDVPLPRILLVIDEFQEFFSEDDKLAQDVALLLDRFVRQGRAFGMHAVLGTQTLAGAYGLGRGTIGQMGIRVALACNESDSQLILADNNSAARLLSRPGEAIYNDQGGLLEGNSPFQVTWLNDDERDHYLSRVHDLAEERGWKRPHPQIVFEGNAPADITRNELLHERLDDPAWGPAPKAPVAWLGDPIAIKEPSGPVFRRQNAANMMIVGQRDEAAVAMLAAAMISLAAQHPPRTARFVVLDGSPAESATEGKLQKIADALPHDVKMVEWRDAPDAINDIANELKQRQDGDAPDDVTIYLIIFGLQRYRALAKQEDDYGGGGFSFGGEESEEKKKPKTDKQFAEILREGPPMGVHTLTWIDAPAAINRMMERAQLREFDGRVLFQMSQTDSSNLIDSPIAGKLGMQRCLYYSEEQGLNEKFRPYSFPKDDWLAEVKQKLAAKTK